MLYLSIVMVNINFVKKNLIDIFLTGLAFHSSTGNSKYIFVLINNKLNNLKI